MADANHDGYEDDAEWGSGRRRRAAPNLDDYDTNNDPYGDDRYEADYADWQASEAASNDAMTRDMDPSRLPPDHPRRIAYERARANERWDAMSWEERQAARGRGEDRDGGWGGGGGGDGGALGDFDRVSADIPIWGDLSGARSRIARSEADAEAARRAAILGDLAEFMPTEDELSTEYRHEGRVDDTTAEGALARGNLTDWAEGGFTDTDRAMLDESRRRAGMAARADREADMSALEARGMGGSGATLASMLSASEGAADRGASAEANMMDAAQQRQYSATNALGEWANRETDYSRGLEGRNTGYDHRTAESASNAAQRAHENRSEWTSFATGGDPNSRDPNAEEDEADRAAGGLIEGIANLF